MRIFLADNQLQGFVITDYGVIIPYFFAIKKIKGTGVVLSKKNMWLLFAGGIYVCL